MPAEHQSWTSSSAQTCTHWPHYTNPNCHIRLSSKSLLISSKACAYIIHQQFNIYIFRNLQFCIQHNWFGGYKPNLNLPSIIKFSHWTKMSTAVQLTCSTARPARRASLQICESRSVCLSAGPWPAPVHTSTQGCTLHRTPVCVTRQSYAIHNQASKVEYAPISSLFAPILVLIYIHGSENQMSPRRQ